MIVVAPLARDDVIATTSYKHDVRDMCVTTA
jgi:hypothetical protein